ncbi:ribonuclease E inhibitor RraB [Thalassotalea psychrophila]|uniref:Regulator of ribonuclease activity B n=1 Tax=Thalassotalea psychrophila TaxID=3065647 RepID=A0ABY9TS68_9GAMM|nr:ribonuclease E inhibitor RraB [Colwelliaceae bacterium SQ149]
MTEQSDVTLNEAELNELQEWYAHTEALVNELLEDGSNDEAMHTIEHHFASSSFEVLESAAIAAFKLGLEVEEPEEAVLENGARVFAFDITTEQYLDEEDIKIETKAMFELAKKCNVDYDGWGTYFEE